MNTRKFAFSSQTVRADLTISEETVLHGMRRTRLKAGASVTQEEDPDRAFLSMVTYPDLLAVSSGTITVEEEEIKVPQELDFERFLTLPGELEGLWEKEVYELNSHFLPRQNDEDAEKKRPQNSTPDSSG